MDNQEGKQPFFIRWARATVSFLRRIASAIGRRVLNKGRSIAHFIKRFPKGLVRFSKNTPKRIRRGTISFAKRFNDGSKGTKISHVIMGAGNFFHKQYTKGAIFLALQVGFFAIMFGNPEINDTPIGIASFRNFVTLGTEEGDWFGAAADNSMLMLLFGLVTALLVVFFIAAYLSSIQSAYTADIRVREGLKPTTFKEDVAELLDRRFHIMLLTPAIIGVLTFTVLPTLFMILIAFTNFDKDVVPALDLFSWVGFDNFLTIFQAGSEIGERFFPVLGWTLIWAFFATFTCYIGGVLLALLINKPSIKYKKLWRTVFVITIALPQFVTLLAARQLVSEAGPFNELLQNVGILTRPMSFLSQAESANTARMTVIMINLWIGVPYTMLITSGILMNVPKDTYEAAMIDGATKFQAFRNITVPYIIFITTPYLITSFVGNITNFNVIFLLTGGGPTVPGHTAGETDLLITWLYKLTIEEGDVNIGSVIAIFTFMITATATLITYRRSKAYREEDTFQ